MQELGQALYTAWMVKRDVTEPAIYALILALLLAYRAMARKQDVRRPVAVPARR